MVPANRYELAFAIEKVDGYDTRPSRRIDRHAEFAAAKADALAAYRRYIDVIESLTFEQYMAVHKGPAPDARDGG